MNDRIRCKLRRIWTGTVPLLLLGAAQPVFPQDGGVQSGPSEIFLQHAAVAGIDAATLDQYAESLAAIRRVQISVADELNQVADEDESYEIEQRAKEKMIQAVLDTGISVEEYQRASQLMNALPELREAVMQRVMEWLGGSA